MSDVSLSGPMIPSPKQPAAPKAKRIKPDVMPAVKQEAGRGGRKKASEIVQDYLMQQTGDQRAVATYMNAMAQQIQKKVMRLIQFGNTVFMATQKGQGILDVHVFTEDSPKTLVHRFQQAYQWAKAHGFSKITSTLTDGDTAKLVEMAGLPVKLQQTTINDGKQVRPAYQMTLEVH